jgi:hypothetical protein
MVTAVRSSSSDLPSLALGARRGAGPAASAPVLLGQRKEGQQRLPELHLIGAPRPATDKAPPAPSTGAQPAPGSTSSGAPPTAARSTAADSGGTGSSGGPRKLSADDQRLVLELEHIDARVRAHEAAHQAAGGALTGAVHLDFVVGPDGRSYAVGGDVSIQIVSGRTPQETIANAEQVVRAALAPADPSGQDLAVASAALQLVAQAESAQLQQLTQSQAKAKPATQPAAQDRSLPALLVPQRSLQPAQIQFAPGQAAQAVGSYRRATQPASSGTLSVSA